MTGDTVGGVWTFTLELAESLCARGSRVFLATLGGMPSCAQQRQAEEIAGLTLFPSEFKLEWMDQPWEDVERSGRWLLDLERQCQADLIHLNTLAHGDLWWQAPAIVTAHSCVSSWWEAVKQEPLPGEWAHYRRRAEASLAAADWITAPTQAMLDAVRANYDVALERCAVVPNSRRASRFHSAPKEPFILAAGRLWDEAKNVRLLDEIAPRLPWPTCLAGEHRDADGHSLESHGCRLLGQLSSEELASWYARASIYASPAFYEPFGLAALEAALSGCVLVLADIPSLREVWDDAAVYVSPRVPGLWEAALQDLIADPERRLELAQRSISRAREFTPDRTRAGYLAAYELATERKRVCVL